MVSTPSKARAESSWVIPPASWKLLKQETAMRFTGVLPYYTRENHCKMDAAVETLDIKREAFGIETNKLTSQQTVRYQDKQIFPIQNGINL